LFDGKKIVQPLMYIYGHHLLKIRSASFLYWNL